MVKIPFRHQADESKKRENSGEHHRLHLAEWLRREDEGIERASSSIFLSSHDRPLAPQRTCIQGHEILPGSTTARTGIPWVEEATTRGVVFPHLAGAHSRSRASLRVDSIWPTRSSRMFWVDSSSSSVGSGGVVTVIEAW